MKALINATNDKDTMFYIKEKDPKSTEEVCALYERYKVLTGHASAHRPAIVKATKPEFTTEAPANAAAVSALIEQAKVHGKQLADLTEAVGRLLQQQHSQPPVQPAPAQPRYQAATPYATPPPTGQQQNQANALHGRRPVHRNAQDRSTVPHKRCPRCGQHGHWARDCSQPPQSDICFRCGALGHMRRDCNAHLKPDRVTAAPAAGPMNHRMQ